MRDQILAITDTTARYWQPFHVTSPGGIEFAGYLCRQESEKLGLLAITELGGEERLEFIYAMPKIHYPYRKDREGRPEVSISVPINIMDARFTEKLDGTAIIFYGLSDKGGNVLEVIPRTRLQPILAPAVGVTGTISSTRHSRIAVVLKRRCACNGSSLPLNCGATGIPT